MNLAWLYHYMGDDAAAVSEADKATARIPLGYHITPGKRPRKRGLPQVFLWVQLGKAHLLCGQIAMRKFYPARSADDFQYLANAALHYTLSLAYDELFASSFDEMRVGRALIYDSLKDMNQKEFQEFSQGVDRAAVNYDLKTPTPLHRFLKNRFGVRGPNLQ